jgi:hypothetical protein
MRCRMWRKNLFLAIAVAGVIAWPASVQPQVRRGFQATAQGVSLLALMPETASLAWSARSLPAGFGEPAPGPELFVLQNQSVLARGRSSEVHCEWEGVAGESSGFLPLSGFPGSAQFQFAFLPRPPVRELILPGDSAGFSVGATPSAFLVLHPSQDAATPATIRIRLEVL